MIDVGMQVVCVRAEWRSVAGLPLPIGLILPIENIVYTVRGVVRIPFIVEDLCGLWLDEIHNENYGFIREPSFDIRAFRPCRKTDIEQFRELLLPVYPTVKDRVPA